MPCARQYCDEYLPGRDNGLSAAGAWPGVSGDLRIEHFFASLDRAAGVQGMGAAEALDAVASQ